MTTQESQSDQPILFDDDENRLTRIDGVPSESLESLADLFIVLRRGFTKEGCGPLVVQAEVDRFIELAFQRSEAYRLALKLYAGRYEIIGARSAAWILREAIEKYLPDLGWQAASEPDEPEPEE